MVKNVLYFQQNTGKEAEDNGRGISEREKDSPGGR